MPKTKGGLKQLKKSNGQFASRDEVKPAVFQSNFPNYKVIMKSYRKTDRGVETGKRLDFSPNGTYETKNQEEIEFLENHMKTCGPNVRIRKKRGVEVKDEFKKKGKGDK